jgi:hypothetical protein
MLLQEKRGSFVRLCSSTDDLEACLSACDRPACIIINTFNEKPQSLQADVFKKLMLAVSVTGLLTLLAAACLFIDVFDVYCICYIFKIFLSVAMCCHMLPFASLCTSCVMLYNAM